MMSIFIVLNSSGLLGTIVLFFFTCSTTKLESLKVMSITITPVPVTPKPKYSKIIFYLSTNLANNNLLCTEKQPAFGSITI